MALLTDPSTTRCARAILHPKIHLVNDVVHDVLGNLLGGHDVQRLHKVITESRQFGEYENDRRLAMDDATIILCDLTVLQQELDHILYAPEPDLTAGGVGAAGGIRGDWFTLSLNAQLGFGSRLRVAVSEGDDSSTSSSIGQSASLCSIVTSVGCIVAGLLLIQEDRTDPKDSDDAVSLFTCHSS